MSKNVKKQENKPSVVEKTNEYESGTVVVKSKSDVKLYVNFNTFHNVVMRFGRLASTFVLFAALGVFVLLSEDQTTGIILLACSPLLPFVFLAIQAVAVRARLNADKDFNNSIRSFEIKQNVFSCAVKNGKSVQKFSYAITDFWKVYEVKNCFYVYKDLKEAYVLPKRDIVFGTEEELRQIFSALGKSFKAKASAKRG